MNMFSFLVPHHISLYNICNSHHSMITLEDSLAALVRRVTRGEMSGKMKGGVSFRT